MPEQTFRGRLEACVFGKGDYPSEYRKYALFGAEAALRLAAERVDAQRILRWMKTPAQVAEEIRRLAAEVSDGR